jgi:hypothetical protein
MAPTMIAINLAAGYPSASRMAPSEMDQLPPHASHDITRVAPKDSPTFFKRPHIQPIRCKQEDQVVGQLAIPRLASNEPAELRFLLGDSSLIGRIELWNGMVPSVHIRHFPSGAEGTKPVSTSHDLGSGHRAEACSAHRRRAEVWDDRTAHKEYREAL